MAKATKQKEAPMLLTDPDAVAADRAAMIERAALRAAARVVAANDEGVKVRRKARQLLKQADGRIGDEALDLIVLPTIERVMNGDVAIVDLPVERHAGSVKVLRTKTLRYRLKRLGLEDELIDVAMRFGKAFAAAQPGGRMTANYDSYAGGAKKAGEPERWAVAMDELTKASRGPMSCPLNHDERVALFAHVLHDCSLADIGSHIAARVSPDKNMHKFTGKLYLRKALEKLTIFYLDWDYLHEL